MIGAGLAPRTAPHWPKRFCAINGGGQDRAAGRVSVRRSQSLDAQGGGEVASGMLDQNHERPPEFAFGSWPTAYCTFSNGWGLAPVAGAIVSRRAVAKRRAGM